MSYYSPNPAERIGVARDESSDDCLVCFQRTAAFMAAHPGLCLRCDSEATRREQRDAAEAARAEAA